MNNPDGSSRINGRVHNTGRTKHRRLDRTFSFRISSKALRRPNKAAVPSRGGIVRFYLVGSTNPRRRGKGLQHFRRPDLNASKSVRVSDRLRRRQEVEELIGFGRASIYRWIQDGEFPPPVRVGSTAVRWKESDIAAWIQSLPTATSELSSSADD